MKPFNLNKKRIKTAAAAVICCLVLTSCWEDFNDKFTGSTGSTPSGVEVTGGTLSGTDITLSWTEPDAVAYTGMKITCSSGTTVIDEETTPKGITTNSTPVTMTTGTENTITVTALYSTGYEIEVIKFPVTPPSSGSQTLRLIYTAEDLNDVRDGLGDYCILMADIDLSGYSSGSGWTPIGADSPYFTGTIEGYGHTISNMTINNPSGNYCGFVGYNEGTIKNLSIKGSITATTTYSGSITGYNHNGTIINCNSTVNLSLTTSASTLYCGGITSYNNGGTLTNCISRGSITITATVGSTYAYIGGLAGYTRDCTITDCTSSGNIYLTGSQNSFWNGGLIGSCYNITISNCYSTGNIYIGSSETAVTIAGDSRVGGFIGIIDTVNIDKCYSTGNIAIFITGNGGTLIGGFIGDRISGTTVTSCYAKGNVSCNYSANMSNRYTGGFIGRNSANVTKCYSTGNVIINGGADSRFTGGFIGELSSGIISLCYSTGEVSASGTTNSTCTTGGFTGSTGGTVQNCYTTGDVNSTAVSTLFTNTGGFTGINYGTITNSYSTGNVSGTNSGGDLWLYGFTGSGTVTNCFYNSDTAGAVDTGAGAKGTALSTTNIQIQANLTNWDFVGETTNGSNDYWSIDTSVTSPVNNGYPYLTSLVP